MCGISGIINKNNKKVKQLDIQKMNEQIIHRGPDAGGIFLGNNFALGHRRLSILDTSSEGSQPMEYLDKYVITYNGEVYNYVEIREFLVTKGYSFSTNTDTEVILASYDFWGEKCVNHFNGMWAFSLFDKAKNKLFCSRDRFGIKPFYYTTTEDNQVIFGSEIKQLLLFQKSQVNQKILLDFIIAQFLEHSEETFFRNILKLMPSHNLSYNLTTHSYKIYKYYEIDIKSINSSIDDSIDTYEKELNRAIQYRLRSDVKVGTCLSGGLDSSIISFLAGQEYNKNTNEKFVAIHGQSTEDKTDESVYAKKVAKEALLDLHIVTPKLDDFLDNIDEIIYTQEEPFGSPSIFMQYFVMQEAKKQNCKVMLDGQGGDETLLGYEKYYPAIYIYIWKKYGIYTTWKAILNARNNNTQLSFKRTLQLSLGFLFVSVRRKYYMNKFSFLKSHNNSLNYLDEMAKHFFNINELQKFEIYTSNLPMLLRYEDKNSMRHSIEARLPFIDYKTLESALSMNNSLKIHDGWSKYVLRKIADKILPKSITWRKNKLGFASPESTWLKAIDKMMLEEIKNSSLLTNICHLEKLIEQYHKLDIRTKWRLFCVAKWQKLYNIEI